MRTPIFSRQDNMQRFVYSEQCWYRTVTFNVLFVWCSHMYQLIWNIFRNWFLISSWLSALEGTKWLQHLSTLLKAAVLVINAVDRDQRPVLVHCSDGWDRTPQIVALSKLLLDPYYRTIEVFINIKFSRNLICKQALVATKRCWCCFLQCTYWEILDLFGTIFYRAFRYW